MAREGGLSSSVFAVYSLIVGSIFLFSPATPLLDGFPDIKPESREFLVGKVSLYKQPASQPISSLKRFARRPTSRLLECARTC